MPQDFQLSATRAQGNHPAVCVVCSDVVSRTREERPNAVYLGMAMDAVTVICAPCVGAARYENQWICRCSRCHRYYINNETWLWPNGYSGTPSEQRRYWGGVPHAPCPDCSSNETHSHWECSVCHEQKVWSTNPELSWMQPEVFQACHNCSRHVEWAYCAACDTEDAWCDDDGWPQRFVEDEEGSLICAEGYGCNGREREFSYSRLRLRDISVDPNANPNPPPDGWTVIEGCQCIYCDPDGENVPPPAPRVRPRTRTEQPLLTWADPPSVNRTASSNFYYTGTTTTARMEPLAPSEPTRPLGQLSAFGEAVERAERAIRESALREEFPEPPVASVGHIICNVQRCRYPLITGREGQFGLCESHLRQNTMECWICKETVPVVGGATLRRSKGDPVRVCDKCRRNGRGLRRCTVQCGNLMLADDPICNCGGLFQYNYKPDFFTFYHASGQRKRSKNPHAYMGFELEMEGKNAAARNKASDFVHSSGLPLYCQFDGSINRDRGLEVVSHPFTIEWLNENFEGLSDVMNKLRSMGYRAWDTGTCGMHVHISKNAMNEEQREIFIHMIYEYPGLSVAVAGRGRNDPAMEQYSSLDKEPKGRWAEKAQQNTNFGHGHYVAVNVEDPETLEVRIFRGTLNPLSFRKNLEYVYSLYAFSKESTIEGANEFNYLNYVLGSVGQFDQLISYLKERYVKGAE